MTGLLASSTDDEAGMLADVAQLTPEPTALPTLLQTLGYQPAASGAGLYAAGSDGMPTLLFPLYSHSGLSVRRGGLVGAHVARSAAIAAGLAALRGLHRRPSLLFIARPEDAPAGLPPDEVISLQGGVVPRIWRGCFGRLDMLLRITGRTPHPGQPNAAINAIEEAVPALQALMRLKSEVSRRSSRPQSPDAPLRPRLTISAAHGGHSGTVLPSLLDLVVSRRYDPLEDTQHALSEIEDAVRNAMREDVRIDLSVTDHQRPMADPDLARRSREERALATGWGWPQVPFCTSSPLLPGAVLFGGLERPSCDAEDDAAATTLNDMAALMRSLRALLAAD